MYSGRFILRLKSFFWAVALMALFLQDVISIYVLVFKYYDEIVAIACLGYYVFQLIKQKVSKIDLYIAATVVVMCVIGFVGNAISGVQKSLKQQIFDAFNIFKYIMTAWGAIHYFRNYSTKRYLIHYLALAIKVFIGISSVFMVANLVKNIGMHTDYRWGMRAFRFIFSRVGGLYSACIIALLVLTAEAYYYRPKYNFVFVVLTMLNMCATLRIRPAAFAVLYVALYYIFVLKKSIKIRWSYMLVIGVILAWIGMDRLEYFFADESEAARKILLQYGFVTAKTYFPFGAGFGSYGTAVARDAYSILYTQYDFNEYWGLVEGGRFLTDNYWPAIMGEFGFIGAVINMLLLYLVGKKLYINADTPHSKVCVLFAYGTLLISSLVSSSFFACTALIFFICLICKLDYSPEEKTLRSQ